MVWIFRKLLGLCDHNWTKWGEPLRDGQEVPIDTRWQEGGDVFFPDAHQRRSCHECGMIQQRRIGAAVLSDSTVSAGPSTKVVER